MLILAHRGSHSRTQTENTIEAFQDAVAEGADGVELDLRVARDEEIVIVHDDNLHRVAGDAHAIKELTSDELSKIPLRNGGVIPTLNEVTAAIHAPTVLDLEVKDEDVARLLITKLKTSAALRGRTIVSSYHAGVLQDVKRECPDVRTLFLVARWPLPLQKKDLWKRFRELEPWGVAFPLVFMNARRVRYLRTLNVRAGAWDWHDRATRREAKKAVRLGLDFAILKHVAAAKILPITE